MRVAVDVIAPQTSQGFESSTHVRLLRLFKQPDVARKLRPRFITVHEFISPSREPAPLVLVQRAVVPDTLCRNFLERASKSKIAVDLDDDLLTEDYREDHQALIHVLKRSDLCVVSTQPLRQIVNLYAGTVEVIENGLDESLWFSENFPMKCRMKGLQVLYAGTYTHAIDIDILQPIARFFHHRGENITFHVVGGERRSRSWYKRVRIPAARHDYPKYVNWLRRLSGRFNVAVAPLANSPINRSKSGLKYLEYSALGLAGVYSNAAAYAGLAEHDETALIASNPGDWIRQLYRLLHEPGLCNRLARTAWTDVRENHLLADRAERYTDLLLGLWPGTNTA